MKTRELEGRAHSYLRFSSCRQERGDSVRRQTELRELWLKRHPKVRLAALTFADLKTSAFRGKNRLDPEAALCQFLKAIESGRVKAGEFLLIENLDRLSREHEVRATHTLLGILLAGVRVVVLEPEQIFDDQSDQLQIMRAVMELGRAHNESLRKSKLIAPVWKKKREAARASGAIATRRVKAWLQVQGDKFVFKPGARDLIRRIYAMATAGHGGRAIVKELNTQKVPHWCGGQWTEFYIRSMLSRREALGEYQPYRVRADGVKVKDGQPIVGYYPAAVTEAEWKATRVAAKARDKGGAGRPPRDPDHVHLFCKLLTDARTGGRLNVVSRQGHRVLLPAAWKSHGASAVSFPEAVFEKAVLSELVELDANEVFGDGQPDASAELAAKMERLDDQIRRLTDQFAAGDDEDDTIPEVAAAIRRMNEERKATAEALDREQDRVATPQSAILGEAQGLVEALAKADAQGRREVRVRLRQALGRLLESATCLFVRDGLKQHACVQLHFAGQDKARSYYITHVQAHGPSGTAERTLCDSIATDHGFFDLRKPGEAKRVANILLGGNTWGDPPRSCT